MLARQISDIRKKEMEEEAGTSPLHALAGSVADVVTEPGLTSLRSLYAVSPSDVSFRSSAASAAEMESDDTDAMYRGKQSEYEETPSFRWIATPLRWWGTRKGPDQSSGGGEEATKPAVGTDQVACGEKTRGRRTRIFSMLPRIRVGTERKRAPGELVHFGRHRAFTLDDLMRAEVEGLGKGKYGTVYRATLRDGNQVAVRTPSPRAIISSGFMAEASRLGKVRHPNLLPLRACYFRHGKDLMLVFDYMPKGSLSAFLRARGPDNPADWPTRMNIAIAVASGLHHLHTQENMVHGNLTSGNILLDDHNTAKIADHGLSRLIMTAGEHIYSTAAFDGLWYRAPELSVLKSANAKTDVYSLGVILLDLVTGKPPWSQNGLPSPRWVAPGARKVFDDRQTREATESELIVTLNLALHCVDPSPDARPEMPQVLAQLEEIRSKQVAATATAAIRPDDLMQADSSVSNIRISMINGKWSVGKVKNVC